ncbi:serine hydrolase [Kitasatospora sp. NPDC057223]|uniref:serine hydrolase n=1 Tax=Kitasatospora sp. NPDC057223 TaxID=3346055 RepID=UPI00362A71E2
MTSRHRARRRRRIPLGPGLFALALALAAALALGTGSLHVSTGATGRSAIAPDVAPDGTPASSDRAVPGAGPTTATPDSDARAAQAVDRALSSAGAGAEGAVSVAVLDLASGATAVSGGSGHEFITASIVKADILATLLRQTGSDLTAQQRTEAVAMIEQSDNDAASALYDAIGGADGLDEANLAFGLTGTTAGQDGYWGLTTTTPADQLRLLQVIFGQDSPLDAGGRAYLQQLMGEIAEDQDWGVSAAASAEGAWMLKNGWLSRSTDGLWAVNSIGRVTHDGHDVLVAVLSDGNSTEEDGIALVESVAVAAVGALAAAVTG